jgi:hypothetical protein
MSDNDREKISRREYDKTRVIDGELCSAYRVALETKINGMEKSIKLMIVGVGFVLACIQLAIYYLG